MSLYFRTDSDYTDIECVATNDVGSMVQPCLYMIVKPGKLGISYQNPIPKNTTRKISSNTS